MVTANEFFFITPNRPDLIAERWGIFLSERDNVIQLGIAVRKVGIVYVCVI